MKRGYFIFEVNDRLYLSYRKARRAADAVPRDQDLYFSGYHWRNGWNLFKYRVVHINLLTNAKEPCIYCEVTTQHGKELQK